MIGFSYAEVGGSRRVDPVWTADCGPHPLAPATPINEALAKSGGIDGSGPEADFLRAFPSGSDVRLPAGTWDITALAQFFEQADCSGGPDELQVSVRITVAG